MNGAAACALVACLAGNSAGASGIGYLAGPDSATGVEFAALGITDGDVFIARVEADGDDVRAGVVIDGHPHTLILSPHSNRGASFKVWTIGDDGQRVRAADPPMTTYRGFVDGLATDAAFRVVDGTLRGVVSIDHEGHSETYAIEPLDGGRHISYALADVIPGDHTCGVDHTLRVGPAVRRAQREIDGPGVAFDCIRTITVASDADFEFYQANGSNVDQTVGDIEAIMNALNLIYEDQLMLSHVMGDTIVRDNVNDPYTSTDAVDRLFQFRDEWNSNQGGIERDVAHFYTGVDLNGGIIGVAWVGVVCDAPDFSYGMSQSRFTGNFAVRVGLTAHELGHNWNAGHCDGDNDCGIMCSFIDGCPCGVEKFGERSVDAIAEWAEIHEFCLGEGPDCNDCPADLDGDGDADADDFFAYLDAFADGNQDICDVDGDGDCDADDFFGYLDLFAQGC